MKLAIKLLAVVYFIWSGLAYSDIIIIPNDYPTIQEGIDVSQPHDTVMVLPGVYSENLLIEHALGLIGENRDAVTLEGNGSGDVILIQANAVRLRNLTIGNSGTEEDDAGVKIISSDSCAVELCRLSGNHNGLSLYNSSHGAISGCIFEANTNGIRFWEDINNPSMVDNYQNIISHNVICDNGYNGIWFDHAMIHHTQNTLRSNRITGNNIGINMIMSLQNEICGNHIDNNFSLGIMHGICEGGGGQNAFYHNNFVHNNGDSIQACNWGVGDDLWFDTQSQEGNYWSNYSGPDNNGDGIGDIPMEVDGYNCDDAYPLMERLTAGVSGMVADDGWVPISDVIVTAVGTGICDTTEYHGGFTLEGLDAGNYDIAFSHPQYQDTVVYAVATNFREFSYIDMVLIPQTGIDETKGTRPTAVSLIGNYPNPFNASTSISFSLDRPGQVKIEIFDLLGRQIETLADDIYAAGIHHICWDGSSRSSGIYFYKLTGGDYSACRVMALVK